MNARPNTTTKPGTERDAEYNLADEQLFDRDLQLLVAQLPQLRTSYLQWVKETAPLEEPAPLQVGQTINCSTLVATVKALLGSGVEAHVYLCEDAAGAEFAAKCFFEKDQMKFNLTHYQAFSHAGVPLPHLLNTDPQTRTVLFKHIMAVPLPYLYFKCQKTLGQKLLETLHRRVQVFQHRHPQVDDFQMVIELGSGNLYCIDPF